MLSSNAAELHSVVCNRVAHNAAATFALNLQSFLSQRFIQLIPRLGRLKICPRLNLHLLDQRQLPSSLEILKLAVCEALAWLLIDVGRHRLLPRHLTPPALMLNPP
jgi:hypothetical protein